ncbi:MAG: chromosomal replication initiator protein DnaA [Candidatus Caenarcaniphilales bacterium]|nr:chromosomal replication initiator protein DnaA [Candidatus Caenarcaniphilales bacterium]
MQQANEVDKIWRTALKHLKDEVPASSFKAWIKPASLREIDENKAVIEVRNEFSKNLLIQNYYKQIAGAIKQATGQEVHLLINVNSELKTEDYLPNFSSIPDDSSNAQTLVNANSSPEMAYKPQSFSLTNKFSSNLNPKFVFDNFIVGSHNQFCHAAALAIAKNKPNQAYNPFFIYGDVGLGKTHLMHSIGNYILSKNPDAKILYLSTEQFLNDLISHMRKSRMNEFRARYRSLDLLLVDDIQFIEGKETTQEEFFHTFNSLKDNGSQIILTSDRPPKAIPRLEPRLCSRFEGGLIADVQKPTYETRLAIISRKSDELKLKIVPNVADIIAKAFPENIRSLEGALFKLQAYKNFTNSVLSADVVNRLLQIDPSSLSEVGSSSVLSSGSSKNGAVASGGSDNKIMYKIKDLISAKLAIPVDEFMSRSNSKEIKNARQICMYVARKAGLSLGEISKSFDGRGNSSILNSIKRVQTEAESDAELKQIIEDVLGDVKSAH